ncbi:non-ribosomal peptide synthetase [Mycobacterium sp.]|uniref:non-ribosomal peptide synthetase n=1 Tax=Mycobacterium sp. TaxID=1785 RepID=UPI003D116E2D
MGTASGPLSSSQRQLWHHIRLAPDSPAFSETITIRKTGPLDVEALRCALTELVSRHEACRTTFAVVDGVPYQFVREPAYVDLPLTDLSELYPDDAVHQAAGIAAADALRPYNLADGPLIRPRLIRITEEDHWLQLGLHQLVFDETTLHRVLLPELTALYGDYATGAPALLPAPRAQYAHYTKWELDWVRTPEVAGRITRWRNRLAGSAPGQLPPDHPRPQRQTFAGGMIPLTIEHATVEGLRRAAHSAGGTLFHALAAAYAWWLHLYAESTDVVFGTAHDLRQHNDMRAVAGYCTTPVALRCEVSDHESFTELAGRIRRVVTEAFDDAVPFEALLAALGVPREPPSNPLFHTQLLLRSRLTPLADEWSLHPTESVVRDASGSTIDIGLELDERSDGNVVGRFVFNADVFDRETAREMASHWRRVLDAVAAAPGMAMVDLDLVSPDERRRQLSWNSTTRHGISSLCVHEVIASQVERTPDAIAVQVDNTTLTYRQLDDRAAVIAARLAQAGAGPGTVVAVLLDRTPDLVASVIGILKTGAALLPLDPRQPAERNAFCINDVGAKVVLTEGLLPTFPDVVTATVLNLRDLVPHTPCEGDQSSTVTRADLAYVIYTSGSTGRPKGVLVEHRGVTNLMHTMLEEFGVGATDTVLSVASISFDLALGDIFCALACGARLVLATAAQAANPAALRQLMVDSRATYMMATATTWRALVTAGWRGDHRLTVVSVGETLTDGLAEALLQRCGSVWNGYGPTEATAGTSVARLAEGDTITVGRPFANTRVYITDSRGRLQPVGVPGEITIGGAGVARGYVNRPDEHARRFGDDPFHVGGRIYRTGDRGRFTPDGRIQHLGRYDDQLKIRGFRIEPDEIESTLCEHPEVGCCAVVARAAPNGEQQLVAYIVGEPGRPSEFEAREWLRRRLPEYMVPSAFMHLSAIPTTSSGKLDKAGLPAPSARGTGREGANSPRNETERRIAALWADLLAVPVSDVSSDFFDMGGHSLLAARLISNVEQTFGVELPLSRFVASGRTIAELAALLDTVNPSGTCDVTAEPPLHLIFSHHNSAMSLRHFTEQWGTTQPVHPLILEQPGGRFDRSVTIEQRASQVLSEIRDRQPNGPLTIAGFSIGGLVAYEVARKTVNAGQQVDWLGILDAPAPSMAQPLLEQLTLRWRLRRLRRRPAGDRWAKYLEVALRLLRSGELWPPQDFDYRGATEIACRYQQPGHNVPMHLFVTEGSAADMEADLLGWDEFHAGPLTVHRLAADHATMLDLPVVEEVARIMLESLRKARTLASAAPLSDSGFIR